MPTSSMPGRPSTLARPGREVRQAPDLGQRGAHPGRAPGHHGAVDQLEVGRVDLHQLGGHVEHAITDRPGRPHDRPAGERGRPRSAGADQVERRELGVAVHDPDLVERRRPSSSAANWASVVSWPWPCGIWLVNTVTVPSGSSRARASCTVRGAAMIPIARTRLGGTGAGSSTLASPIPSEATLGPGGRLPARKAGRSSQGQGIVEGSAWVEALELDAGARSASAARQGAAGCARRTTGRLEARARGDEVEQALTDPGLDLPRAPVGHVGGLVGGDDHRLEGRRCSRR